MKTKKAIDHQGIFLVNNPEYINKEELYHMFIGRWLQPVIDNFVEWKDLFAGECSESKKWLFWEELNFFQDATEDEDFFAWYNKYYNYSSGKEYEVSRAEIDGNHERLVAARLLMYSKEIIEKFSHGNNKVGKWEANLGYHYYSGIDAITVLTKDSEPPVNIEENLENLGVLERIVDTLDEDWFHLFLQGYSDKCQRVFINGIDRVEEYGLPNE